MGAAFFYHMTESPLEATLPALLGKSLQAGWRVVVRGTDKARLEWLDQRLWQLGEEAFLPHGLAGGEFDADQPVLLTTAAEVPNGASCVMATEGAEVLPDEVHQMERVCILFDGNDTAAVNRAREQWKALTGAGCSAQYWAQDDGRWVKKSESNG